MANKRQRSDDNEPPDYHPAVVGKISGSSTARQHPRKNKTSQTMLIMPPLETIPSTLVDLQRIINMGGCPRCGHIDAGKCGKIKGGTVQKYRCKHCKCYYHECQNDYVRKEARLTPDVYQDHTLEGKQRVITLANHAYEQITKNEMNQDEKIFQQRIQVLYAQLVEKRRNVSKLLGIILPTVALGEEDNNDNNNSLQLTNNNNSGIDGETSEKKIDSTSNSTDSKEGGGEADTKSTSNNNNNNSVDPFRDAILLLRNETSKLEQRMFALQQRQDQMMKSGEEDEEVDILNDDNPPRTPMLLGANGGGGATYQLASKIVQEGGEEITIYEKKE